MYQITKKRINVYNQKLKCIDWAFFLISAVVCYILFCQVDIRITAEHSFILLQGNITDFYEACKEWNGAYAANYLPSTYMVFAIWNIPLKLLGKVPTVWGQSSAIMFLWYKLLPVTIYLLSGIIIYRLTKNRFGFSSSKAKLTMYIYYTAPLAFFSQFIFSQYDIFTVALMLLGMYYYYSDGDSKKDFFLFVLYFSLATTFKYYAVLIFATLLLLRVKNIGKIIWSMLLVATPYLIEYLLCLIFDGEAFKNAVMGFQTLDFVKVSEISVGFSNIRILPLLICLILAWCYFTTVNNKRDLICYSLYFCCGITFVLFSFMTWYPQWLLFGVPFWSLSLMISKRYDVFLWLETAFIFLFYMFIVNIYQGNVDQSMLKNTILAPLLRYKVQGDALMMSDIYRFSDTSLLFTLMVVILLVLFIFKHPRFCFEDITEEFDFHTQYTSGLSYVNVIRIRFIATVLGFLIPALLCVPSMIKQADSLWLREDLYSEESNVIYKADEPLELSQYVTLPSQTISSVSTKIVCNENADYSNIYLQIIDPTNGKVVASSYGERSPLKDNEIVFDLDNVKIAKWKQYECKILSKNKEIGFVYMKTPTNNYQLDAVQQDYETDYFYINGDIVKDNYLAMQVMGRAK